MAADSITALGAGSGVDVKALATSLVEAERAPLKATIDKKISKSQAMISGYSAVKFALSNLQSAFADLKDKTDFKSITVSNNQTSAFTTSASTSAVTGGHTVLITQLATAQRSTGTQIYATADVAIPGLTTLTLGGTGFPDVSGAPQTIAVTTATPTGVVDAINNSGKGLSAQLVSTGSGYKVVVTGASGASNAFTIAGNATTPDDVTTGLNFSTSLQSAANAALTVDGIAITSSSNSVTGAITGVTLNLLATNTGAAASLNLANDTSGAKTKVLALVTAYNDVCDFLKEVTDPKSTLATYGGTLAGNSSVAYIKTQLREMMIPGSTGDSSTPSGDIKALRDLGLEIDSTGKMTVNSVKLDMALMFNYDSTVTMLSGNQEDQGTYDTTVAGIAGDSFKKLTAMLASAGSLTTESSNASKRITAYQDSLAKLEERMAALLARYNKQFGVMNALVGQTNALRTSLTSSFDGMMSIYTKK